MAHLIDKAAVLAEIRKYINNAEAYLKYHHNRNDKSVYAFEQEKLAMCELLSSLDTLEVQEEPVSEQKLSNIERTGENRKEPKFKVGDRIKFKGVRNEDVTRVITNIQKGDGGGFRYLFADGSIYSIGDDGIELVEEPVSEELEKAADSYIKTHGEILGFGRQTFKAGAKWQKTKDESCSKDLGEYINELSKQFPEVSFAKLSRIAVRVAKWKEKEMQSTIELAEDHAYFAGRTKTVDEIKEALLSEVLPCFMHGGEADEVVAKLDEVLNQKK